jgi:alkanesulfonate monooxygenase SsuD/methylene tetrahydromethanopterin reductase-like flavin-dependent oxidoreductase (luciferase family)
MKIGAAAAVTKTSKLGTGVCLVVRRDPIQTAKEVATVDRLSNGRLLFGIGAAGTPRRWPTTARRSARASS